MGVFLTELGGLLYGAMLAEPIYYERTEATLHRGIQLTHPMITFLLVGLSVVALLSAVTLITAWRGAVDGYEDETGFHPRAEQGPRVAAIPTVEQAQAARRSAVARQLPRVAC